MGAAEHHAPDIWEMGIHFRLGSCFKSPFDRPWHIFSPVHCHHPFWLTLMVWMGDRESSRAHGDRVHEGIRGAEGRGEKKESNLVFWMSQQIKDDQFPRCRNIRVDLRLPNMLQFFTASGSFRSEEHT